MKTVEELELQINSLIHNQKSLEERSEFKYEFVLFKKSLTITATIIAFCIVGFLGYTYLEIPEKIEQSFNSKLNSDVENALKEGLDRANTIKLAEQTLSNAINSNHELNEAVTRLNNDFTLIKKQMKTTISDLNGIKSELKNLKDELQTLRSDLEKNNTQQGPNAPPTEQKEN